jgi:heptosyltransferase I
MINSRPRRKSPMPAEPPSLPLTSPPRSLAILRLSALGDVCHTVPIVRTLAAEWPETRLVWIVGRREHALLAGLEGVRLVPYPKDGARAERRRALLPVAEERFDVLLQLQPAIRASLLARRIRAPLRLGFDRARSRDAQWLFTNARIAPAPPGTVPHVIDTFFAFLEALGLRRRVLRWDIPIPEEARARALSLVPDGRSFLVLSPCAQSRFRNPRDWPAERLAEVAHHARRAHGLGIVVTGGLRPEEKRAAETIRRRVPDTLDLTGRTDLKTLLALLARARALVAPDSGPVHMAAAVGTPVVGLYAATDPRRAGPYTDRRWCVDRYPEAVRRYLGRDPDALPWGTRVRHPRVMDLVETEAVVDALDRALAHASSAPASRR